MTQSSYRGIPLGVAEHKPLVLLLVAVLAFYTLERVLVAVSSKVSPDEWRNDIFLMITLVMAYFVGFAREGEKTLHTKASKAKKALLHTKAVQHGDGHRRVERVLRAPGALAPDAAARPAGIPAGSPAGTSPIRSILAQEPSSGATLGLSPPKSSPQPSVGAPPGLSLSPAAGKDAPAECDAKLERLHSDECTLRQAQENGVEHDMTSYSKVMAACNRCNRVDIALKIFKQMLEKGVPSDSHSMHLYIRTRFFKLVAENLDDQTMRDNGLRFLEMIQAHGLMPTHLQQNRLICAWRSKLPPEILKVLADIKEQGASLSSTAYRCLMAAHERTDPEHTLKLYEEMVDRRIKLDQVAVNAAICACSHLGKSSQALQLFSQMTQLQLSPNGKTYGALIRACTATNRWNEALDLFDSMLEAHFEPNRFAYHDAILCCIKTNQIEFFKKALKLYGDMKQAKVPPSDPTYSHLIKMCQTAGWTETANEIMDDSGRTKKTGMPFAAAEN